MKLEIIDYGINKKYCPMRKYNKDAGMDVYLHENITIQPQSTLTIGLKFGLHIPTGFMIQFIERSSMAKQGIIIGKSPVDAGYTGEMHLFITNITNQAKVFQKGDRLAQMVLVPIIYFDIIDKPNMSREDHGLGSSGR